MRDIQSIISEAFENRREITPRTVDTLVKDAVTEVIECLDRGELRVAEKRNGDWIINHWIIHAVQLALRIEDNRFIKGGFANYYDKIPSKYADCNSRDFRLGGVRVVPPATARKGAYIGPSTVLMPCYINIGAYIGSGTMVDTWATVGSCAQIGRNVHLSGGVGIGGMLEPLQSRPTIIEDDCFIGAHSEVVEGVIVEQGTVISMGVYLGQSTKIYHRQTREVSYGRIPAGSVVVPGNLPAADGSHSVYCAIIIKQVDAGTRAKVGINQLLRDI